MIEPKQWYDHVHNNLRNIAEMYGLEVNKVIGIFVSLSAQKDFDWNMKQTIQYIRREPLIGMYSRQQIKACDRILAGEDPLSVWHKYSFKYRNFYDSLLLRDGAICVDTHMINAYLKKHPHSRLHRVEIAAIFKRAKLYNTVAKWIKKEASINQLKTYEMQAVLWVQQRGQLF